MRRLGGPRTWAVRTTLSYCVGAGAGLVSGLAITLLLVPDFVATLAMLSIARGATLIYTGGQPIGVAEGGLRFLGAGTIGPFPVPIERDRSECQASDWPPHHERIVLRSHPVDPFG